MALPAGWIIQKWGYRRGVITGLVLFGIGSLMFIPGSEINSFYFFVLSLFVIWCGLTCLETSANPYTTVLGHPDKAESRINLSQSLNGIGWIVGPLVGGQLLFSGVNIAIPYAMVGIFVLSVALILSRITLPDPRKAHEADTNEKIEEKTMAFAFGMLTLFLYVAAQTGVNSFYQLCRREHSYREADRQSLSRFWWNGIILYRKIGWWCGDELYPAEAGPSSLCDFGIALHVDSSSMQWQDIVDSLLRFVFRREHYVPHHFLPGVEGCRHSDEASLLPSHYDDSWWCHSSGTDGIYS